MSKLSERKIVLLAIVFAFSFVLILVLIKIQKQNLSPVACTMEAKICPDGSAVGRTGPKCEFSLCPEVSATPTPIKNYNGHYIDERLGLSFNYPKNYRLEEGNSSDSDGSVKYISIISPSNKTDNPKSYLLEDGELKVEIYIRPNLNKFNLEQYFDNQKDPTFAPEKNTYIGKIPAKSIQWQQEGSGITYYFVTNKYMVNLLQYPAKTSRQSEFNQIVSTFKFTDSKNEISNWKTYSSDNYPLSFRYPSDWTRDKFELSSANSIIDLTVYGDDAPTISAFLTKQDEISAKGWEGSYSIKVNSTKKTVIAGLNCVQRQETVLAGDFETYSTYFKFGRNFYQLSIRPKNSSDLNMDDVSVYQQILSTFKFTN